MNHFDHSNQNERNRTKPCNLVDDATELKSSEPDTPPYIETSQQTGSGKWTYYLTHWTFLIWICNEIVAPRSETKLAFKWPVFWMDPGDTLNYHYYQLRLI